MAVTAKVDCRVFCHINSLGDKISNTAAQIQPNSFWFWEKLRFMIATVKVLISGAKKFYFQEPGLSTLTSTYLDTVPVFTCTILFKTLKLSVSNVLVVRV